MVIMNLKNVKDPPLILNLVMKFLVVIGENFVIGVNVMLLVVVCEEDMLNVNVIHL
jgi:hypothetical protein